LNDFFTEQELLQQLNIWNWIKHAGLTK
jgi:hypothetical protein